MEISRVQSFQTVSNSAPLGSADTSNEDDSRQLLSLLTDADRELVYQTIGTRLKDGDVGGPMIAFQIALDRRAGHISPGQQPSLEYFQSMLDSYRSHGVNDKGFEDQLCAAIDYLRTQPRRGIDVNA